MKQILLGIVSLFSLAQCSDATVELPTADLLIGSWTNAANEATIAFDKNSRYTVRFDRNAAFDYQYQVKAGKAGHRLFIYDSKVTHAYEVQFLGPDELQLVPVVPQPFDLEKRVNTFYRLK